MNEYSGYLRQLRDIAINEGYDVKLSVNEISYIKWKPSTLNGPLCIGIDRRVDTQTKIYFFLHELGHHFLRKNWVSFERRFPVIAKAERELSLNHVTKYTRRNSYSVSYIEEEYLAWDEGLRYGLELGIPIDLEKWERLRVYCLMDYIRFYGQLKIKNDKTIKRAEDNKDKRT